MHNVALPTDGGAFVAHFGRAPTMAVFTIDDGQIVGREDRLNPDPEHLDPAHHRVMLNLMRGCQVVIAAHIGPPIVASLVRSGVQVLGAPSESVQTTLEAYLHSLSGGPRLEELHGAATDAHHHQHAHA